MEFDKVVEKRKSVRSFKDKNVSWKDILEAIDSACNGPFADGINHLKFLIIEKKETIDSIAEISSQLWINESSIVVVVCSDDSNLENMHGERGRVYSRQQAGAAISTLMLKLTDLGLSSCWVGSFSDEKLKRELGISSDIQVEAIIPIGYEKGKSVKKKKKALENAIYWETWEKDKRPTMITEADDEFGFH